MICIQTFFSSLCDTLERQGGHYLMLFAAFIVGMGMAMAKIDGGKEFATGAGCVFLYSLDPRNKTPLK